MVIFAKVKYLITLADTFYFFWLQVMGNYLVYVRENRTFAGSSDLQLLRLHGNINNHFVYFFYTLPENFRRLLKKKLNSMRVFIGQAALTFCSPSLSYSRGAGGGGGENSWEFLVEVCRPVLQILTLFQTKNIIFTPVFRHGL